MPRTVKKQRSKHRLRNTRNKSCKSRNNTACCPHMIPDSKGRYASTATKHILKYGGKHYKLLTCCKMCGDTMNILAKETPNEFSKIYISRIDNRGNIHAKNRHTGKVVQILRVLK
mgnify:CR=1 FL=1